MTTKTAWNAQIDITEEGRKVTADATLIGKGGQRQLVGHGVARCNPADQNDPAIGDELAAARALADLTNKLLDNAAHDIESHTHQPVKGSLAS
ncbi:dsRBD fold-containing protein [Streptomyces sp. XH2]|uniref:dsRBD fold-containing protein n=1 Tax=Streptomyces sp. XH2 TaxID=3412483 RepID=UPI003C7B61FA